MKFFSDDNDIGVCAQITYTYAYKSALISLLICSCICMIYASVYFLFVRLFVQHIRVQLYARVCI